MQRIPRRCSDTVTELIVAFRFSGPLYILKRIRAGFSRTCRQSVGSVFDDLLDLGFELGLI